MGGLTMAGNAFVKHREAHHAVARLVAIGASHQEIRRLTGHTYKRISLFMGDPAFCELVEFYKARVDEAWNRNLDTYLELGMANMIKAEGLIQDRLDEEGDDVPLPTLNRISQDRADRFGYPKTSQVTHKHDFATALDRAIERSGKAKEVKVIEATAVEVVGANDGPPLAMQAPAISEEKAPTRPSPRPSIVSALTKRRRAG